MTGKCDLILANALIDLETSGANRGFQLGLVYIATYIEEHGFNVKIITDVNVVTKIYNTLRSEQKTPILGFYVTADNVQEVIRACLALKNLIPDIKIILGGPEARVDSKRLITNKYCDYVCSGDGEETCLQLLQYLNSNIGEDLSKISNLTYQDQLTGKIVKNPSFNLPFNLDYYPIPKRELYDPKFLDVGHIATARGCVSECTFCYEGLDKKIRRHSVDRVIDEMKYLNSKFGTRYFSFVDDTFTTDRRKIYSLCEKIKETFVPKVEIGWYCEAKVSDICNDPHIVETMIDAGLIRMQFGSESGSQAVLNAYKKEITPDQVYKAVEIAMKAEIASLFTNYIIGGALETVESYKQTLNMAIDLMRMAPGVLECSYTYLSPYNGTDIRTNPDKYEVVILDGDFNTAPSDSYIFAHSKNIKKELLLEMGQEFQHTIHETMESLVPLLKMDTIRRHFIYSDLGMSTTWSNFLNKDPFFRKWGLNIRTGHEYKATIDRMDIIQFIPYRTFELEKIRNGELFWGVRSKRYSFDSYELFLIELASGKLTIHDIVEMSYLRFDSQVTKVKITADIISFYNSLANEFLITFRRFA